MIFVFEVWILKLIFNCLFLCKVDDDLFFDVGVMFRIGFLIFLIVKCFLVVLGGGILECSILIGECVVLVLLLWVVELLVVCEFNFLDIDCCFIKFILRMRFWLVLSFVLLFV